MHAHSSRRTRRTTTYASVPVIYAKRMPNVCNVHQRMDNTISYVGVSTPLNCMAVVAFLLYTLLSNCLPLAHSGITAVLKFLDVTSEELGSAGDAPVY